MSTLKADTIVASDGSSPVTLTKQSAAKVWGLYDQTNNVTDSSFGTSSITDSSTGRFNVAFTNSFSLRPAVSGLNSRRSYYNLGDNDATTTSDVDLATDESNTSARDRDENCFVAHGDLA